MDEVVQKMDPDFFSCLENMRQGTVNADNVNLFTSRMVNNLTGKGL